MRDSRLFTLNEAKGRRAVSALLTPNALTDLFSQFRNAIITGAIAATKI